MLFCLLSLIDSLPSMRTVVSTLGKAAAIAVLVFGVLPYHLTLQLAAVALLFRQMVRADAAEAEASKAAKAE